VVNLLFHDLEVATLKARSPNLSLVRGTNKSAFVAERKDVWRSERSETEKRIYCKLGIFC